jgi:hypothetical protein
MEQETGEDVYEQPAEVGPSRQSCALRDDIVPLDFNYVPRESDHSYFVQRLQPLWLTVL